MVTFAQAQPGIFAGESGGDYNALYGYQNRPGGSFANTRLTDMSVGDVIDFTNPRGDYAAYVRGQVGRTATPVGAYQVVGTTLRGAVDALGIDPSTPFNQATQDRIGEYIFNTQGTGAWEGYRGPQAGGQGMDQGIMAQSFVEQQPQQQQQPQDPMSNLSRSQRMMLGFAALRDAAASLEGQQSSYFGDTLGGFQQQQMQQEQMDIRRTEQERLRRQGMMQNQIAALGSLREIESEIAQYSVLGREVPQNLITMRDILNRSIEGGLGGMTVGSAAALPVNGVPATPPSGSIAPIAPSAAPSTAMPAERQATQAGTQSVEDRISQITSEIGRLGPYAGLPNMGYVSDRIDALSTELDILTGQQEADAEMQEATQESEQRAREYEAQVSILDEIISDPNLQSVTGRIEGAIPRESLRGTVLFNEEERELLSQIEQIQGAAFLQAFESLKGGGQITEREGQAATEAISRLGSRDVSTEAYQRAAEELRRVFANAAARERGQEIPFPNIREGLEGGEPAATAAGGQQASEDGWTTFGDIRIRPVE